ncbi:hypothetical protein ACU4GD_13370 [Cupriavidus basilensis]
MSMGTLQRRLWVHAETERASGLAAAGQQAAALGVLQQTGRYAQQDARPAWRAGAGLCRCRRRARARCR